MAWTDKDEILLNNAKLKKIDAETACVEAEIEVRRLMRQKEESDYNKQIIEMLKYDLENKRVDIKVEYLTKHLAMGIEKLITIRVR